MCVFRSWFKSMDKIHEKACFRDSEIGGIIKKRKTLMLLVIQFDLLFGHCNYERLH